MKTGETDIEEEYKPTNREKSQEARPGKHWCICDMALVGQYGRCPICGKYANRKKRIK